MLSTSLLLLCLSSTLWGFPGQLVNSADCSPNTCTCKTSAGLTPLLRSWNCQIGDHFYTTNRDEQLNSIGKGYVVEANMGFIGTVAGYGGCIGMVQIYRLVSPTANDHFYTTSYDEMLNMLKTYNLEGTMGYCMSAPGCGLVPLHRFWNPSISDHFYTSDQVEKDAFLQNGAWKYQGIQCYVWESTDVRSC
ncbi:unnamed protein product, partial [Mesorhabditis belari]|uniref:DUF5648 domain-containing protein n=1 Tax=Mesorhabditis belari TaxID=2138241 RepID=A0AAF3F307_9BILA